MALKDEAAQTILRAVKSLLAARKDGPPTWTGDDACTLSDAYRSEVTIYNDSPPEAANRVRLQLAKFGDRVRVTYVDRPLEG